MKILRDEEIIAEIRNYDEWQQGDFGQNVIYRAMLGSGGSVIPQDSRRGAPLIYSPAGPVISPDFIGAYRDEKFYGEVKCKTGPAVYRKLRGDDDDKKRVIGIDRKNYFHYLAVADSAKGIGLPLWIFVVELFKRCKEQEDPKYPAPWYGAVLAGRLAYGNFLVDVGEPFDGDKTDKWSEKMVFWQRFRFKELTILTPSEMYYQDRPINFKAGLDDLWNKTAHRKSYPIVPQQGLLF